MLNRRNMFDHRKEARKKMIAFVPVYNQQLNILLGYLVDLTLHGAKVEGEHPARIGQRITLGIEFPEDPPEISPTPFTISARVVRCNQEPGSQNYTIGFEFNKLNSKQTKVIQAIINRYAFRPVSEE
jgi:hypothetical protein